MATKMRYSIILLAGLWAAGPAAAASWADRLFDDLSKDFGSVPRGPALTHHFRITNNTNNPVNIASVRVSCGCVTANAMKTYLAPGEETAILMQMDTTRFIGAKSVTIYVQFDRPKFEEVRLWVRANGRNDFNVSPDTLALGQVKRTTTPVTSVTLTFYGNFGGRILEAKGESNYVRPTFKEVRRLDSEVVYQLTATIRADTPVGRWYTDVWLKTNIPNMEQLRVPLTVEIEAPLTVSPVTVGLGEVKAGKIAERKVIVRGVRPFRILSVEGADKELSVHDSTSDSKTVHVLTVTLQPQQPGELLRRLRVMTDLKGEETIEFNASAQVVP